MNLLEDIISDEDYLNFKINQLRRDYENRLYKKITQYSMIVIERRIRDNEKIKDALNKEWDDKLELEFKKPIELQNTKFSSWYIKQLKSIKTNWKALEDVLIGKVAMEYLHQIESGYFKELRKVYKELNLEFVDEHTNFISESRLESMVEDNIKWLKRHYNSFRMIKSFKAKYDKKYYLNVTKIKNNIGTRTDANKKIGINKVDKSKKLVLITAIKLKELKIKITISSITKEISKNSSKSLGKTQIAKYLKLLRDESQI
jgi:hypothetical protein